MRDDTKSQPPPLPPKPAPTLGESADVSPASRRLRWLVGLTASLALIVTLIILTRPDPDSLEAKVSRILEQTRRDERNQEGVYAWAENLFEWPEPFPKLGRWIRDESDEDEEWVDVEEELLSLGEEVEPLVLRMLETDPSPAVREELCDIVIKFDGIDPLPVLTNLLTRDPVDDVRASAVTAAVELDPERAAPALLAALKSESEFYATYSLIQALPKLGEDRALQPLLELLKNPDNDPELGNRQEWAAHALGELGGNEAMTALRSALESADDELSVAAARALAHSKDRESLPRLIAKLEAQLDARAANQPTNVSRGHYPGYEALDHGFVGALGEFRDPSVVPVLLRALELTQPDYERRTVVEALGKIGDERALDPILDVMTKTSDEWLRQSIITAIAGINSSRTVPALLGVLTNYPSSATHVIESLSSLSGTNVTVHLREILRQSTGRAREAAAFALGMSGDPEALPVLLEAIDSSDDEARKAAAEALGMVADPSALTALTIALKDGDSDVRQEAAWALGYVADPRGAPGLITVLDDAEFGVRFAAAFALAGIQDPSAVEPLKALLKDEEQRVRIAAACSLCFHASDAGFDVLKSSLEARSEDWHRFAAIVGLLRLNSAEARRVLEAAPADTRSPWLQTLKEAGLKDGPAPALVVLLRDGDDEQRHYAARVLPYFRDESTLPALRSASSDESAEVRSAARVAAVQLERKFLP